MLVHLKILNAISGTRKILFLSNTFEQMKIYKY